MGQVTERSDDITALSTAEQAALGSGATFWTTKAVGDVRSILLTDGPHGVRRQSGAADHVGIAASEPATCFPPAAGLAQSWDPQLVHRVAIALGNEARALGVNVLLGPGINIKRDPRCGRNFEYFAEDPLLTGVLGAAWVSGVQSRGVGASPKHFAANNAEDDRMRVSSEVDERTLREIYLRGFEHVITRARPWTVMCSYNRINGVYAAENEWLLSTVLRDEWGFDGAVVSDWGAVRDRVAAVAAGLDLEMPGTGGNTDDAACAAMEAGDLDPDVLTRAAQRVARLATRAHEHDSATATFDIDEHHDLARTAAARSIVLLKNDGDVLPLNPASSVAVVGAFAVAPRYQGGGSSHVNPTRLDIPLEEIEIRAGTVTHADGITEDTLAAVAAADAAVVFLGLPAEDESEGFDRADIELPDEQLQLLAAVVRAQPRTVAVLSHGGVVRLQPVADLAPAILDGALLGQGGGAAIADVLFGAVNPSGKLTETVPVRLQDCPAYLNFPAENGKIIYGERIFVGYRGYDARDLEVTFPFGHGLSYTDFSYDNLTVEEGTDRWTVRVTVTNNGSRLGREVVQIYAGRAESRVSRPPRWLVGFGELTLPPGDRRTVEIAVARAELAHWDVAASRWVVEAGDYSLAAGASSRDVRLSTMVSVSGDEVPTSFTVDSTLGELLSDPAAAPVVMTAMAAAAPEHDSGQGLRTDMLRMLSSIPIGRLASLSGGTVRPEQVQELLATINAGRSY
ncbi:glycoside hydrolase family 3 C-terminal domain-containing protein [Arthrobacter sp. SLBN-53]|uniref:glycoside hydrolase family 3 C-terminal domain-containing protein n=1 Tax=Arthrobacter sp. SLBN-53 TaxID=2768412 RepID=UPI00115424C6|nr:glycoside hydrolase family 3 C-terminal domain-containing protein [Arthrobacter sp. SLBN-53]TQK31578.1 beta-glucosidase [Arthrobacter sp. SLBN-53]